jgi:hypothetical protein
MPGARRSRSGMQTCLKPQFRETTRMMLAWNVEIRGSAGAGNRRDWPRSISRKRRTTLPWDETREPAHFLSLAQTLNLTTLLQRRS